MTASTNSKPATKSSACSSPTPKSSTTRKNYRKVAKQHRDMEPTVEKFREYRKLRNAVADAKAMLTESDPDMREMAQAELDELEPDSPRPKKS